MAVQTGDPRKLTVAIIGGGPGGSSCAIKLLRDAGRYCRDIEVFLIEGKDFQRHFNQCVGVLSPPIEEILSQQLGLTLPEEIIKRQIFGYRLHGPTDEILLVGHPDAGATYALKRAHLDRMLISEAAACGANIIHSRVTHVEFLGGDPPLRVRLYSEGQDIEADCVIGAFGLDDAMLSTFEQVTAYRRPARWLRTFITKVYTEESAIKQKLGHVIQAYLLPPAVPGIEFGAITPKDDYIVVNIAGETIDSEHLQRFISLPAVRDHLPNDVPDELDMFEGRFPTSKAVNAYGHRYAMVGDATGWMRPFKGKGINTALMTGAAAAQAILEHGVLVDAFCRYEDLCQDLLRDHIYGTTIRNLALLGSRFVLDAMIDVAKTNPVMYDALFDAVSGEDSYRSIIHRGFRLPIIRKVAASMLAGKLPQRRRKRRSTLDQLTIRKMTVRDIDAVLAIDEKITGKPHAAYYEAKVAA